MSRKPCNIPFTIEYEQLIKNYKAKFWLQCLPNVLFVYNQNNWFDSSNAYGDFKTDCSSIAYRERSIELWSTALCPNQHSNAQIGINWVSSIVRLDTYTYEKKTNHIWFVTLKLNKNTKSNRTEFHDFLSLSFYHSILLDDKKNSRRFVFDS